MTSDFWLECGLGHNIYRLCLAHSQRAPDQGHSVAGPSTTERSLHGVFGYFRYQSCGFPAKRCHHTILLAVARVSSLQHHLHRQQSHQEFFSEWGNLKEKSAHFMHIFMYAYEISFAVVVYLSSHWMVLTSSVCISMCGPHSFFSFFFLFWTAAMIVFNHRQSDEQILFSVLLMKDES